MSIKETLYVVGVVFKNTFILRNFYELVPLTYHGEYTYTKGSIIPYFGIENSFISIIPKLCTKGSVEYPIRGIRKISIGGNSSASFGNSVAIDFQILQKNYHIKVSSSKTGDCKFHITGLTRYSHLDYIVKSFIEQLKCIEQIWIPFFQLDYNFRMNILNEIYNIVVCGNQLRHYDDPYVVNWIESLSDKREQYKPFIKLIVRYVMEEIYPDAFSQRLLRLCSLQPGPNSIFHVDMDFIFVRYDIYNGSYIGTVGYNDLYFIFLVRKLVEMGFHAGFSNLGNEEIRIKIEIQHNQFNTKGGKAEEKKEHLFVIKSGGSVALSSKDTPSEALAMGQYVINVIRSLVESPEYLTEKNGIYYNNANSVTGNSNFSNIQPQTQNVYTSMVPTTTSSSILDMFMNEYDANTNI